jgi:hypothetical protein
LQRRNWRSPIAGHGGEGLRAEHFLLCSGQYPFQKFFSFPEKIFALSGIVNHVESPGGSRDRLTGVKKFIQ